MCHCLSRSSCFGTDSSRIGRLLVGLKALVTINHLLMEADGMSLRPHAQHDCRFYCYLDCQYALVPLHGSVRQRAKHRRCFRETETECLLQEHRMANGQLRIVIRFGRGASCNCECSAVSLRITISDSVQGVSCNEVPLSAESEQQHLNEI
jgi:hypothetical protein